jgi:hypothetical protein
MKIRRTFLAAAAMVIPASASAQACNTMRLRVSQEWGTAGDVASRCAFPSEQVAGNARLEQELRDLAASQSSDAAAYDARIAGVKSAFDACSVDG